MENNSPQSVRSLDRTAYEEFFLDGKDANTCRFSGVQDHIRSPPLTPGPYSRGVDRNVSLPRERHQSSECGSFAGSDSVQSTCEFYSTDASVTSLYRRASSSFASLEPADSIADRVLKRRDEDSEADNVSWANENVYERVQLLLDEPRPRELAAHHKDETTEAIIETQKQEPEQSEGFSPIMVEIAPHVKVPLRGAAETEIAIANSFYVQCECIDCQTSMYCILDCEYFLCPECRSISPSPLQQSSPNGGLGMGFQLSS